MTRYGSTATTRTALRALIRSIRTPVSLQRTVALLGQVAVFLTVPVWGMDARSQEIEWELLRPTNSGIPGEIVENVVWAPDGKLWVAAEQPQWQEGGVGILDLQTEIWTGFSNWQSPLPSHFVGDIKFDAQGVAWIGSSGGLTRFDGENWMTWNPSNSPMQSSPVQDVEIAPDGTIWINNTSNPGADAIFAFDGVDTWTRYAVPNELPWPEPWTDLGDLFVDSNGHVWVANQVLPGLAEFDGSTWTLHDDPDFTTLFESIVEDQQGNLWMIGNQVSGHDAYYRFDGQNFTEFPFAVPTIITVDPEDGAIYCANWHGTILRSTDNGASWSTWLSGLNIVLNIAPRPGTTEIWVGTAGAVGRFTNDGQLLHDYNTWNTGMPDFWVDRMTRDRSGHFWLAMGEAGLSRFDGLRWRNWGEHNAGSEPYPFAGNDPMGTAYEDVTGTHWFGGNGIARWDSETGEFTGFWNRQNNPGLDQLVHYFAEDLNGMIWAATKHATPFFFDGSAWVRGPIQPYTLLRGCPGMQADSQGHVWLSGAFDFYEWDGTSWTQQTLPNTQYFADLGGINRMVIDTHDVFWFATMEGLVRWDGNAFTLFDTSNTPIPALAVRGVDVRDDGLIGISAHDNSAQSSGIALVDAAHIEDPSRWSVFLYGQTPQPDWQIEDCTFDPWGNLWVSALSEGVAILHHGLVVSGTDEPEVTLDYALHGATPNPFRPFGSITFELPPGGDRVTLAIFDVNGRMVRSLVDGTLAGGLHSVTWDSRDEQGRLLGNGVYFARMQAGTSTNTSKLTLVR